ncbi:hypothetical protein HYPSUDRAFT_72336 [Hypholoma sublateritium FD-334 SS-4]|uniref:Uncharacterized protein n=1 Tax=Hypholoma sublateritium (strain FD-334 SS-4) TaxID=945553 RepID=A0A0D2N6Z7_HYPSF|nr:hypothetical protein HYPSUDRAFT_72336 [Hypholoma sublateritium FD-334 SS-4]
MLEEHRCFVLQSFAPSQSRPSCVSHYTSHSRRVLARTPVSTPSDLSTPFCPCCCFPVPPHGSCTPYPPLPPTAEAPHNYTRC